jgi:Ran GTPase-activating protein (RanGAP) involved in mRNA processing and transport
MKATKTIPLIQKTKADPRRELEEVKLYFDSNKSSIHRKLHPIYEEILSTGQYKSETANLNFVNLQKTKSGMLQQVMPYFQSVKILKLWKSSLGSEGLKTISQELSSMALLEVLSLEDNSIGPDGCMYLSISLRKLINLRELWLHINEIGPVGASCLADVLGNLKNLEKLNLDENAMENKGTLKLVSKLKTMKTIKTLGLAFNGLSEDAVLNIAVILGSLSLEKLVLTGNSISEDSHSRILTLLPRTLIIF